jgi:hypothetical protein
MAWRDATFIIETLEHWARDSRISWVLSCEGEHAGKITPSGRDGATEEFLSSLKSSVLGSNNRERIAEIDHAFADRWE